MSEDNPSNVEEVSVWPPHKHAFEQLQDKLEYGAQFTWDVICELLGIDKNKRAEWTFLQEWFALRELIQSEGFFASERGMRGVGVRLLLREEMAALVNSKERRKANDSLMRSTVLSKVPREGLSEGQVRSLDHWENKAACIGATSKALIRKRKLPPIEMVTKTIKEITHSTIKGNEESNED